MLPMGTIPAHFPDAEGTSMPAQGDGSLRSGSIFRKNKSRLNVGSTRGGAPTPHAEEGSAATKDNSVPSPETNRPATAATHGHKKRDSSISSLTELRSNLRRRSASLRSSENKNSPLENLALTHSGDQRSGSQSSSNLRPTVTSLTHRSKSSESIVNATSPPDLSSADARRAKALPYPLKREDSFRPGTSGAASRDSSGRSASISQGYPNASNPSVIFNRIHEVADKRMATFMYLQKGQSGKIYWFNTLLFTKSDLAKLPYYEAQKLGRRATNFFMLGFTLPQVLDPNSNSIMDYLRTFNAVLSEFESYQSLHPPDGSTTSSLPKVKVPGVFKRAAGAARRSGAAESFMSSDSDSAYSRSFSNSQGTITPLTPTTPLPGAERELLPGEEYTYLLTPFLPHDPDYFEVFATICDVLVDSYDRIKELAPSPEVCGPAVGDLFAKVDNKVKKLIITGIVKDFEDASKKGVKAEMAGIGQVVLGGLMG